MSCRSVTLERVQVCTVIKSEERVLGDCFMFVRLVLGVMSGVCLWGEWFGLEVKQVWIVSLAIGRGGTTKNSSYLERASERTCRQRTCEGAATRGTHAAK